VSQNLDVLENVDHSKDQHTRANQLNMRLAVMAVLWTHDRTNNHKLGNIPIVGNQT